MGGLCEERSKKGRGGRPQLRWEDCVKRDLTKGRGGRKAERKGQKQGERERGRERDGRNNKSSDEWLTFY